jgi:hypothetical protein
MALFVPLEGTERIRDVVAETELSLSVLRHILWSRPEFIIERAKTYKNNRLQVVAFCENTLTISTPKLRKANLLVITKEHHIPLTKLIRLTSGDS